MKYVIFSLLIALLSACGDSGTSTPQVVEEEYAVTENRPNTCTGCHDFQDNGTCLTCHHLDEEPATRAAICDPHPNGNCLECHRENSKVPFMEYFVIVDQEIFDSLGNPLEGWSNMTPEEIEDWAEMLENLKEELNQY